MLVLFGEINQSIKLPQVLTSFLTAVSQARSLWGGRWCHFAGPPGREGSCHGVRSQKWGTGLGKEGGQHGSRGDGLGAGLEAIRRPMGMAGKGALGKLSQGALLCEAHSSDLNHSYFCEPWRLRVWLAAVKGSWEGGNNRILDTLTSLP